MSCSEDGSNGKQDGAVEGRREDEGVFDFDAVNPVPLPALTPRQLDLLDDGAIPSERDRVADELDSFVRRFLAVKYAPGGLGSTGAFLVKLKAGGDEVDPQPAGAIVIKPAGISVCAEAFASKLARRAGLAAPAILPLRHTAGFKVSSS